MCLRECFLCVFVCSYMSVLNACQGIYLVSAVRHVCLFSCSNLRVCAFFADSVSGKYFPIPLCVGKKLGVRSRLQSNTQHILNNLNTHF